MKKTTDREYVTVYSTDQGRLCPGCGKPIGQCLCRQQKVVALGDGIVRVSLDKAGRKGKGMTVITGLGLDQEGLRALAKQLKSLCGSGGTVKDGTIEIQGDQRQTVMAELATKGYRVKRAGG